MWSIIKSEIIYQGSKSIFILTLALPFIIFLNSRYEGISNFWAIWLIFAIIQNWLSFRNKGKRDYKINQLPLSLKTIAWSRILIVFFYSIIVTVIYNITLIFFFKTKPDFVFSVLMPVGIILSGFSFYFILRDTFLNFFRKKGITQQKFIVAITTLFVGLNLVTVYAFIQTKSSGSAPFGISNFLEWVENHNPFFYHSGVYVALITGITLSLLTVLSYNQKKIYIE